MRIKLCFYGNLGHLVHRRDVYLLVMSFIIDSSLLPTWWWWGGVVGEGFGFGGICHLIWNQCEGFSRTRSFPPFLHSL